MIFDLLAYGLYLLPDYSDGIASGQWGLGYYLFHAAALVTLVCAIWALVDKIKVKKRNAAEIKEDTVV